MEKNIAKLKAAMVLALLFLSLPMMAESYQVRVNISGVGGKFRYRFRYTGGDYVGDWSGEQSASKTITVPDGQFVYLRAVADDEVNDVYFVKWTGNSENSNYTINVKQAATYTCNFTNEYGTVTATLHSYINKVTISISGRGAVELPAAGKKVGVGASCVLTAEPKSNCSFAWYKRSSASTDPVLCYFPEYSFTVTGDTPHYVAGYTAWEGDLENGVTYTLTTDNPDANNDFKVTCSNTSSPYHNQIYRTLGAINVPENATCTIILNNSKSVNQKKTVTVGKNATLNIKPQTGAQRLFYRLWFHGTMFDATAEGSTLKIGDASASHEIIIWGGTRFNNKENNNLWDARGYDLPDGYGFINTSQYENPRGVGTIIRSNGNLVLNKVRIRGAFNDGSAPKVNGEAYPKTGGAIYLSSNGNDSPYELTLNNVIIEGCYATAGAAIYLAGYDNHTANLTNVTVTGCYANGDSNSGAGIVRTGGSVKTALTLTNCTLTKNQTTEGGGAIYWNAAGGPNAKITLDGCEISYNDAKNGGGAVLTGEAVVKNTLVHHNNAINGIGGGLYAATYGASGITEDGAVAFLGNPSNLVISNNTKIYDNVAKDGGGIYYNIKPSNAIGFNPAGDTLTAYFRMHITDAEIYNNTATRNGGGIAIIDQAARRHRHSAPLDANGDPNPAYNKISGLFVRDFVFTNVKIYSNSISSSGRAGGIFIQKLKNSNIQNNGTDDFIFDYTDAGLGHPSAGTMNLSLSGCEIYDNSNNTGDGGGLELLNVTYTGSALPEGYESEIKTTVTGGLQLTNNSASGNGGGIYLNDATLFLKDQATITGNHVPASSQGGGIYVYGTSTLYAGGGSSGTQWVKCYGNYAGSSFSPATQNNVYLPDNTKYIILKSDISNRTDGVYDTRIGITVNHGSKTGLHPVMYVENAANETWLSNLMGNITPTSGALFDDTQQHIAIHTRKNVGDFDKQYIYFGDCWTTVVNTNPGTDHIEQVSGTYHIKTNQGLAWFSSLVNGLNLGAAAPANTFTTPQRGLNAVLDADVDMSAYIWVPLGAITAYNTLSSTFTESSSDSYTGSFDGQGHVISGLNNGYLTGLERFGLFGSSSGTLENIFVDGFSSTAVESQRQYYMGCITGACRGGTISNCEARGTIDLSGARPDVTSYAGGIAGVVYSSSNAKIHSCIAIPDIRTGSVKTFAGGLVGTLGSTNSLKNSLANVVQISKSSPHASRRAGGLAGVNMGAIENCYVRLQTKTSPIIPYFGWFAGTNEATGTITTCYIPGDYHISGVADNATTGTTYDYIYESISGSTNTNPGKYNDREHVNGKYGFAHWDEAVTGGYPGYVDGPIDNQGNFKGLVGILNTWVDAQTDGVAYSHWMRTMASNMNRDLPILKFDDFNCVGSKDNLFLYYDDNVNDLWTEREFNTITAPSSGTMYLYAPQPVLSGQTLPDPVTITGNTAVPLYINENVGITQDMGNALTARVGVTLDNSSVLSSGPTFMTYDWHMFSSALRSAPMGLVYRSNEGDYYVRDNYSTLLTNGVPESDYNSVTKMDPPQTTWNVTEGSIGYFPTDTPYGPWRGTGSLNQGFDFYCYDEPTRHWINFKREGALAATSTTNSDFFDHWCAYVYPSGSNHENIPYLNETTMVAGKGYMVAVSQPSMLMADGELNNAATQTYNATCTEQGYGGVYDNPLRGVNLVGNPYQSYLDFNLFAGANSGIDTYYVVDADQKGYIAYTSGATPQEQYWLEGVKSYTASRYIHPHQGFFVFVDADKTLNFTSTMRVAGSNTTLSSSYRDWEPRYALINMACTDSEGCNDFATVELDRPEVGGGKKVKGLHTGDACIWFRLEEEDYQIAFAPVGTQSIPLNFQADADGVYTLRWNMQNADFSYLHLIDNITGIDIDCLKATEYRFEGNPDDYTSRFRLVFDFTGIDEPEEDNPSAGSGSFAFIMNDELVVSGEGLLQVFDITGRQLMSTEVHGEQSTVSLPKAASGVYVLRLTSNKCVRTQKMVINQ